MTRLFEILVDSGGEMRKSLDLIKLIPFDLARKLVNASKIFSNKLPETAVRRSTDEEASWQCPRRKRLAGNGVRSLAGGWEFDKDMLRGLL